MTIFLTLVNQLFDLIFFPFSSLDPIYGLAAVSLLTSILMVLIFRYTSNQAGIKKVKDRIKAHLLAIRLFQDQIGVVLRTHGQMLGSAFTYMGYSLKPLAVIVSPHYSDHGSVGNAPGPTRGPAGGVLLGHGRSR